MIIILRIRDTNIEEIDSVYGRETNAFAYEWFVQLVQHDGTCSFSVGSEEGYKETPFTRTPRKFNLHLIHILLLRYIWFTLHLDNLFCRLALVFYSTNESLSRSYTDKTIRFSDQETNSAAKRNQVNTSDHRRTILINRIHPADYEIPPRYHYRPWTSSLSSNFITNQAPLICDKRVGRVRFQLVGPAAT